MAFFGIFHRRGKDEGDAGQEEEQGDRVRDRTGLEVLQLQVYFQCVRLAKSFELFKIN